MRVTKTKVLISFAVTAKLICVFVFAYAKCWFSHDAAQIRDDDSTLYNGSFLSSGSKFRNDSSRK